MGTQYGFSGLSNFVSDRGGGLPKSSPLIKGRVRSILLDNSDPKLFIEKGEWTSIGLIEYDDVLNPSSGNNESGAGVLGVAYPLFPNLKFYPVVGEIVVILSLPNSDSDVNPRSSTNYYLPPVNIWNSIHHNAIPDFVPNNDSQRRSYEQTIAGSPTQTSPTPPEFKLGKTFIEKADIRPLIPYEGDHILEGRWGNSIRIGSTVKNARIANQWSSTGDDGDPIIVVRNGQTNYNGIPTWQNIAEDINTDKSSIYLTSTQKLPFFPSSDIRDSFRSSDPTPLKTNQYSGNQILLNSGRLTLNASTDSVVISSPNVIHLSAGKSINLDSTSKTVISTNELYLGDREANQRVILGDRFLLELQKLVVALEGLAKACTNSQAGGYPVISLNTIGPALESATQDLRKILADENSPVLSQNVKVK